MASQKTSTQGFVNAFNRAIAALKNGEKVEISASVSDTHLYLHANFVHDHDSYFLSVNLSGCESQVNDKSDVGHE